MTWLFIQVLVSTALVGILALVQVLIYPQFAAVGATELARYAALHGARISWVVIPLMLLEVTTLLALFRYPQMRGLLLYVATTCLLLIWLQTWWQLVPLHGVIIRTGELAAIQELVAANMWRTALWVIKTLAIVLLYSILSTPGRQLSVTHGTTFASPLPDTNGAEASWSESRSLDDIIAKISDGEHVEIVAHSNTKARLIVRTRFWRFPDLVLLQKEGDSLRVRSQSLLGRNDLGANANRLEKLRQR